MSSTRALQPVTLRATFGLFSWRTPTTRQIQQPPSAGASPTGLFVTSRVSWSRAVLPGGTTWRAGLPSQMLLPLKRKRFHPCRRPEARSSRVPPSTRHGACPSLYRHGWCWRAAVGTGFKILTPTAKSCLRLHHRHVAPQWEGTTGGVKRGGPWLLLAMGKRRLRKRRTAG